ncbi:5581_t:CDS:1, partial [Scutellospora calospora]
HREIIKDKAFFTIVTVNAAIFFSEITAPFQVLTSSNCSEAQISYLNCTSNAVSFTRCSDQSSVEWYYVFNIVRNLCYLIIKPGLLYLAYIRCTVVVTEFRSFGSSLFHHGIVLLRSLELLTWFIVSILDLAYCQGSYCDSMCKYIPTTFYINDIMSTIFRSYYIFMESIFYRILFKDNNKNLFLEICLQKALFTFDILQLLAMCSYRIAGLIIKEGTPTYLYAEICSTALTIFVMTRFWHMITPLLKAQKIDGNANIAQEGNIANINLTQGENNINLIIAQGGNNVTNNEK